MRIPDFSARPNGKPVRAICRLCSYIARCRYGLNDPLSNDFSCNDFCPKGCVMPAGEVKQGKGAE